MGSPRHPKGLSDTKARNSALWKLDSQLSTVQPTGHGLQRRSQILRIAGTPLSCVNTNLALKAQFGASSVGGSCLLWVLMLSKTWTGRRFKRSSRNVTQTRRPSVISWRPGGPFQRVWHRLWLAGVTAGKSFRIQDGGIRDCPPARAKALSILV
jgi:hypothetical protein